MQKILVTGANGFVGYYLVRLLLAQNYSVIATGRGEARLPFQQENFLYETMDFTNHEEVSAIIERHQPGIVVHSGAITKPDECELNREGAYLTNVTGTLYLLKAAERNKSHFIFLSTDFVFSGEGSNYREDDVRGPVNYYGHTKMMAEDAVMQYGHKWTILRMVLVYGKPFLNRQNILTNTALALQKGDRLKIFTDQHRTPTYVEDLVTAITSIIEKKEAGIFHVSGKDVLSPYEMAIAVARHLHLDERLVTPVTEKDFTQPARRPPNTSFDISKARRLLDYEPTSFAEGLAKTFGG